MMKEQKGATDYITTTTRDHHDIMDAGEDGRKRLELASRKEERRTERVLGTLRTNLVVHT